MYAGKKHNIKMQQVSADAESRKSREKGNLSFEKHHRRIETAKLSIDKDCLIDFLTTF